MQIVLRIRFTLLLLIALGGLFHTASAGATDPADVFDAPGQRHANACVPLASASAPLRFGEGTVTGSGLNAEQLAFYDSSCPTGSTRLDLHEVIPSAAGPLVFHRGGMGYIDSANVKYGELAAADLAGSLPAPIPSSGGRGAPCSLSSEPPYAVAVRSIPRQMHYKRPALGGSNSGSSFLHYGDPGADQGNDRSVHYTYLLWSFVDVKGGGTVRTLLPRGQTVNTCDAASLTMDSLDSEGAINGQVTARYVRAVVGSCPLYGWMIWSHSYLGAGPITHAAPALASPEPTPGPGCPVSAAAAAPTVSAVDATARGGGLSLAGAVNPTGVSTTYHFELRTSGSRVRTSTAALESADSGVPVNTEVAGLLAGTRYRVRLVASNTHGVTYGPDRVATTAASSLALSGLQVRPSAFRRAPTRRGGRARIRFTLATPGDVRLTFERRTSSRGRACGVASGHGRRCVRWVSVRGTLRQSLAAGIANVRFGGWVAGRPLPPGRYRLHAVAGTRWASFTLR